MTRLSDDDRLLPVLRTAQIRAIEQAAADAPLMERAGEAAAKVALRLLRDARARVVVLAGPGNNGGDAFVVARHLRAGFCDVTVLFVGDPARLPPDAAAAYRAWTDAGGTVTGAMPAPARVDLVIDGLFGLGLRRPIGSPYDGWIEWTRGANAPILALDVPSGIDAETGAATGAAIEADATATFIALKPGLLTGDGLEASGEVSVHTLGLDPEPSSDAGERIAWPALARALPDVLLRGMKNVHKGTFGTLAVLGGADGMIGAPLLAGRAALRLGAGRVRVGFAAREHPMVDPGAPELMAAGAADVLDKGADVFVVGPGFGTEARSKQLLARAVALEVPLVLDADALTLLARDDALATAVRARTHPVLLTPHPAEAARLLHCDTADVQRDRVAATIRIANAFGAHVVLKGAGSVLAHPDERWAINTSGNVALATAGSGDVLAGIAGAMLAQRIDAGVALRLAVCLHGAAADALVARGVGPLGVLASEIADAARTLLNENARAARSAARR